MKAIQIARLGGPEVLELVELPPPVPKAGEALIRQRAAGVNFIDTYQRSGLYPTALPYVLGREGAGVVEAVGDGVTEVHPGQRVAYPQGPGGGYGELVAVAAALCVPIPDGIDDDVAAAALLQGMTAHYLCNDTFALGRGDIAVVHAAAGGVGNLLVQLAKGKHATVIATAGSAEKVALAREAGADHAIDYSATNFADAVRALVGDKAVDVVYDSVGKATWERSMSLLRTRGMLVCYGNSSGPVPPVDPLSLMNGGSLYLTRPTLAHYMRTRDELLARAGAVFDAIREGALRVRIGARYKLADAAQAHRDLEARATVGKLILVP